MERGDIGLKIGEDAQGREAHVRHAKTSNESSEETPEFMKFMTSSVNESRAYCAYLVWCRVSAGTMVP